MCQRVRQKLFYERFKILSRDGREPSPLPGARVTPGWMRAAGPAAPSLGAIVTFVQDPGPNPGRHIRQRLPLPCTPRAKPGAVLGIKDERGVWSQGWS